MPAQAAILICFIGVAGLFYLDRNKSVRTSWALWLPVLWIGLSASRGVAAWFGMGPGSSPQEAIEGSPLDAAVFGILMAASAAVIALRWKRSKAYLAIIVPILIYSTYCLISLSWSPIPGPALKRWIKDVGDVAMVLVVVTDPQPITALRRLYSRLGFLLLPVSVALIRYTTVGRGWDADGNLANVGVTTNKNSLGLIVFVITLGALWNVRSLLRSKGEPNRNRRLLAQCILLTFGLMLLSMAHSSTSLGCFALGSGVMLTVQLRAMKQNPLRIHMLCIGIIVVGVIMAGLGGTGEIAEALGRESDLSGRTVIWAALFPAVSSPIIGTGFDSFWNSPGVLIFQHNLSLIHWYHPEFLNEAHNGYLEVYLNLGWIGVALIAAIMISGYLSANRAIRRHPDVGSLVLANIMAGSIYNLTEAGFRTMNPMWMFLLTAIVSSKGIVAGLFTNEPKVGKTSKNRAVSIGQEESINENLPPVTETRDVAPRWMERRVLRH